MRLFGAAACPFLDILLQQIAESYTFLASNVTQLRATQRRLGLKTEAKFRLFIPVQIRGGMSEMSESIFSCLTYDRTSDL